jgi:hypothetical protein
MNARLAMTRLGSDRRRVRYQGEITNDNDIANVEEHPRTTLGDLQGDQSEEKAS